MNGAWTYEPILARKRRVIVDTDIGPDCDDAGSLAVALTLQKRHGFEIAGIVNCTSNPYGDGAIDAIVQARGGAGIPIGRYERPGFLAGGSKYNQYLSERLSPAFAANALKVEPATDLYRRLLSESEDQGVVVIAIGPLNTVCALLRAEPSLVRDKVYALISMFGCIPEGIEYNVKMDVEAAAYVCDRFPAPVVFLDHAVGKPVLTGYPSGVGSEEDPVYMAYRLYSGPCCVRSSWDPMTVHYALTGDARYYALSEPGRMTVEADGTNRFVAGAGRHYYIRKAAPDDALEAALNDLIQGRA